MTQWKSEPVGPVEVGETSGFLAAIRLAGSDVSEQEKEELLAFIARYGGWEAFALAVALCAVALLALLLGVVLYALTQRAEALGIALWGLLVLALLGWQGVLELDKYYVG
jgi:hypothetical protein